MYVPTSGGANWISEGQLEIFLVLRTKFSDPPYHF